ncbi:M16 family metallopeptidase [Shumkonia mesophila]|uniref:M16 family metallopeptidase n=1 Tax=Shumkonia mesophila TaxID=2838854 RepID=UPI00293443C2|nr:pitrilysin family protein [Shumkonia mesophila]
MKPFSRLGSGLRAALAAAAFVATGLAGPFAGAAVFNPETFTLANGMQVVVVPNHRMPVVTHMVWYRVGAADEADGESGSAHFLEHLMFKGTETLPAGVFSQTVARNGGRENAFTASDYTAYHQTVAKDRLELVMRMEADRMTHLILNPEQVEPERQVILEERRMRTESDPGALLGEYVDASLFLNYPYRRPVIGWEQEIRSLSVGGIMAFYRKWYAPNNAILVVAGDITAAELKPLAEKYYGVIPRGPDIQRLRPQEPEQRAPRRVVFKDDRVRQPEWSRVYLAPSYFFGDARQIYALEVLADVLGSGATSRFYRHFVVEGQKAVSAGVSYSGRAVGPGRFGLYVSPRPGVTLAETETAVDALLAEAVKTGITAEEVQRAKDRIIAGAIYARDSLGGGARVLGAALAIGLKVEDVEEWPERIRAVTTEEVNAALRAVLDPGRSVTSELLPANAADGKV